MFEHRSARTDPLTPSESQADWDAQGWSTEPVDIDVAPKLATTLSIRFDPKHAKLLRQAARMKGMTKSEFVRLATITAAKHCIETTPALRLSFTPSAKTQASQIVTSSQEGMKLTSKPSKGFVVDRQRTRVLDPA